MKVSIIIPVYNVEKYLNRCIESVVSQSHTDLEIILVDDGSIDNSGVICDEFQKLDSRISVIHKNNGGLSSARNKGLEKSSGSYIFFLDSDDYLSVDCIEKCIHLCKENDADVAIVQMMYIAENTNEEIRSSVEEENYLLSAEEAIEASLYQVLYSCCAPAKLYSRNVIGDIRFPLGKVSEDLATCHLFMNNAKKVVYSNFCGYYYRQRNNSIMHTFNPKRMDALKWAIKIEKFCSKKYPRIVGAAKCRTFNVAVHLILDLPDNGEIREKYDGILWKQVERTRLSVIHNKKARFRERAAAVLCYGGEKILKMVWNSSLATKHKKSDVQNY